jgi:hypothetical protein
MGEATESSAHRETVDDEGLLCPFCGYDLRANPSERCSECGEVIDRELAQGRIPWIHRRYIGRARAYVKTVWMVTSGTQSLRQEPKKRLALDEARRFRAVTVVLIWLGLLGVMVSIAPKGMRMLEPFPAPLTYPDHLSPWTDDLFVPWAAAACRWYLWPVALLGLAVYLSGAPAWLFKVRHQDRAESARAIGYYAASVIAWCTPILFLQLIVLAIEGNFFFRRGLGITMGMIIMSVVWILLMSTRIMQWSIRTRGGAAASAVIGIPYLWLWWLWGGVVWLGIIPWCIGWVWIVVDSFLK